MDIDINLSNNQSVGTAEPPSIPMVSLNRLAKYHHYLVDLDSRGVSQISGKLIGRDMGCLPVQVRKDLKYTGIAGKPGAGYQVRDLIQSIENFLGWNNVNEAFLVGAGNLGSALLGYQRFSRFGLKIVAAFDTDPEKIGQTIHGKTVLSFAKMGSLVPRMGVRLGIITTPPDVAQAVARAMVKSGIEAIWNFAPVRLNVPDSIFVHNEDLYSSLATLSWQSLQRLHEPLHQA